MGLLLFKKIFHSSIRDGSKRTTLRRWDRPRVKAGRRAFAPGVGWLIIEVVETIQLKHLSEEDARADGFTTLIEMRKTLRSIYPSKAKDGKRWWRIRFAVEEENRVSGFG